MWVCVSIFFDFFTVLCALLIFWLWVLCDSQSSSEMLIFRSLVERVSVVDSDATGNKKREAYAVSVVCGVPRSLGRLSLATLSLSLCVSLSHTRWQICDERSGFAKKERELKLCGGQQLYFDFESLSIQLCVRALFLSLFLLFLPFILWLVCCCTFQ